MFTALTLSLALGAPVPPSTAPVATGTAPRVMELKADANGKVMVPVMRSEQVQLGRAAIAPAPGNPGAGGGVAPAMVVQNVMKMVEIGEVKDLVFTTADGMKVDAEAATKKLASGAIVVISNDGKPVSPAFLKVFKDDTLVLVSPELIAPVGGFGGGIGRPIVRPLPAPIQGGIQIQPGVIQIAPPIEGEVAQPVPVPVNKIPKVAPVK